MVVCHGWLFVNMWTGHKVGISLIFFSVYSSPPPPLPAQAVNLINFIVLIKLFFKGFYIFYFMLKKHFPERTQSKSKVWFWGSVLAHLLDINCVFHYRPGLLRVDKTDDTGLYNRSCTSYIIKLWVCRYLFDECVGWDE